MTAEYSTVAFKTSDEWREWLAKHHGDTDGVWMRLYKKASGVPSITIAEALDNAPFVSDGLTVKEKVPTSSPTYKNSPPDEKVAYGQSAMSNTSQDSQKPD